MADHDVQAAPPLEATPVAAIDIGSSSIRMAIAQVSPDGEIRILENLHRAVRLGLDTFRRGRLSTATMRAAIAVLRDYRRQLDLYHVQKIRAVATSAVREAANSDAFLDRIFLATNLEVVVINTSEESRLTVSAMRQDVGKAFDVDRGNVLFAEVGGGSTLLTVLQAGKIAISQSLLLGSIRLQEAMAVASESPARSAQLLRRQIATVMAANRSALHLKHVRTFIATGADARLAAKELGEPVASTTLKRVSKADLNRMVRRCESQSPEKLARGYGLSTLQAEALRPALFIHHALLHETRAKEMIVSQVTMRDGLLLDLARSITGQDEAGFGEDAIQSAMAIAEKYQADLPHARHVAHLATSLFDKLASEHGLKARHRLLLHLAGLVHEVGGFVSSRAHHKHSYYLIANSEIFGLTREEILTVALLGRYHRRSCPKPSHSEFTAMPREIRMIVSKLAALLRLADAMDRGHAQQVHEIQCERHEDELVIFAPGVMDLTLERQAVAAKSDLFEEVYGLNVRLEESASLPPASANRPPPAGAPPASPRPEQHTGPDPSTSRRP